MIHVGVDIEVIFFCKHFNVIVKNDCCPTHKMFILVQNEEFIVLYAQQFQPLNNYVS